MKFLFLVTTLFVSAAWAQDDPLVQIQKQDAYGPGVHMDQYGRPAQVDRSDPNVKIQKENAYGPGIHMDQYGRPVKIK